ncbi:prepilin peptidase [Flavobacterium sp. JLP]|uniref:prepilin peptidase n=1 Tax=unclassified Flavobacterium TaxID=196869 RepID=UPI0009EB95B8|nr:prepilin peptidase [Flavobacterium sp. MR2016-29]MBF4508380.1 prepilin peptidase [Flavobacterium sp. JLP]
MKIAPAILLLCLIVIFIQDWKYRKIHIVLPILIFSLSILIISIKNYDWVKIIAFNLSFFLITLSILTTYMSLKSKKFLNPFQHYFGLGDLLFYAAITPLFLLKNYILFFILSMIFAILLQFGLKKFIKEETVPLAGFSSLFLFIMLLKDHYLFFQKITLL